MNVFSVPDARRDVHLNGIIRAEAIMNAETLPQVVMPTRDRFVLDDREARTRVW